jgi:anti-anti-sigma regulatory factor
VYTKTKKAGEVLVLEPHGKLYLGKPQTVFENAVQEALDDGHKKIVLDLKHVPAIDSNGIASIVKCCYHRAQNQGAEVKAVIRRSSGLNLYVRFCVVKLLGSHDTVLGAVGAFAGRRPSSARSSVGRARVHDA